MPVHIPHCAPVNAEREIYMTKKTSRKPKRNYLKNEPEVFWYLNAKKEKLWGYRYRYYDSIGKRREKSKQGLASENIAIRGLLEVKTDLVNGNIVRVDNANMTVSEWLDVWYETYHGDWEITSHIQRRDAIENQMKPLLGKYKLSSLTRSEYRRSYINELLKSFSSGSVALFHQLFRTAVNAAVEDEIIPRNRFNGIKIPDADKIGKENFLTVGELKNFLFDVKQLENITNYTATLVLAYTGLRKGELQGLTWKDVDETKGSIAVNCTRDKHGQRTPKTKQSYRTILVDPIVLAQLKSYKAWCKQLKFSYGGHLKDDDFIFLSHQSGKPISDETINSSFNRVIKKTGMEKNITPHGLRHTHATILISQKIPLNTIANRLGNTPEMILNVYGHSFKELEEELVVAFGNALSV